MTPATNAAAWSSRENLVRNERSLKQGCRVWVCCAREGQSPARGEARRIEQVSAQPVPSHPNAQHVSSHCGLDIALGALYGRGSAGRGNGEQREQHRSLHVDKSDTPRALAMPSEAPGSAHGELALGPLMASSSQELRSRIAR
eukprot:2967814-Prymnesium_polylepis.1